MGIVASKLWTKSEPSENRCTTKPVSLDKEIISDITSSDKIPEPDTIKSSETPLKNIKDFYLADDPRSPSSAFSRTPIVLSVSPEPITPQARNKHLDRIRNFNSKYDTGNNALEASSSALTPQIPSLDACKRKSFVLLETNIDYTETDLDAVFQNNLHMHRVDPRSPSCEIVRTPVQLLKRTQSRESFCKLDVSQPSVENSILNDLPTTALAVEHLDAQSIEEKANNELIKEDVNEEVAENETPSDTIIEEIETKNDCLANDSACNSNKEVDVIEEATNIELPISKSEPVSPPSNTVTPKKSRSQPITPPVTNLTVDVKELDKKLTHLIYEDETTVESPKTIRFKNKHRPPLGLRNLTENENRPQKLRVSDKPKKIEYVVSKIPVFKDKKIKVHSENIPPGKSKKSCWDPKDQTLVI